MKKGKAKIKKSKPITENQFGVVLEKINSNVELVLEGYAATNKKLDDFVLEMREFKGEMYEFKEEMTGFKEEMIGFKHDTESNFRTVLRHLSGIDDELKSIKFDIADIKKTLSQKADLDRMVQLENRVAQLERQLAAAR